MDRKVAFLAIALLGSGRFILTGQQAARLTVFTTAQAEAGRTAFENSCAKCHTYSLLGRKGSEGELPPLSSLTAPYLAFPGVSIPRVPALMGKDFVERYGKWTAARMFTLFRGAADTTPVSELNMSDETLVNITAYILQKNGAKPGNLPLTTTTDAAMNSIIQ
jgi:hypothetical protein